MNKNEIDIVYFESINNIDQHDNYLNNRIIHVEIKSIQRSIAIQQHAVCKILNLLESLRVLINSRVSGGSF